MERFEELVNNSIEIKNFKLELIKINDLINKAEQNIIDINKIKDKKEKLNKREYFLTQIKKLKKIIKKLI